MCFFLVFMSYVGIFYHKILDLWSNNDQHTVFLAFENYMKTGENISILTIESPFGLVAQIYSKYTIYEKLKFNSLKLPIKTSNKIC